MAATFPFCSSTAPFWMSGPAPVKIRTLRITVARDGTGW